MDIQCPKCGEPWDFDSLHEETGLRQAGPGFGSSERDQTRPYEQVFNDIRRDFTRQGCKVLGGRCSAGTAHPGVSAIYELLGDDIDGAAALLDDFGYLDLLD